MNDKGWTKKHRTVFNWGWFGDDAVYRFFDCCILDANIEDGEFLGIQIPRGSFATSYRRMSERYLMSPHKIKRCIKCLKKTGEIKVKSTKKFTVITVVNYEKYQGGVFTIDTQLDTHMDTHLNTQLDINQRNKEIKNSLAHSVRVSEFSQPSLDDVEAYADERGAPSVMAVEFYEFYESNGWMVGKNPMRNWKMAFNGWMRRHKDDIDDKPKNMEMNIL